MTKFAIFAALAAATVMAAPAAARPADPFTSNVIHSASSPIRLAQADVRVRIGTPATKKKVVKKKVIVRTPRKKRVIVRTPSTVRSRTVVVAPRRKCRTVTVRKRVNGRTVIRKTRRCR